MTLPKEPKARKAVPIYSGLIRYFPDALAEVAELSRIGNDQHNPGEPLHWARDKSADHLDALARHLLEADERDTDGVRHATKIAWRALAELQTQLEKERDVMGQEPEEYVVMCGGDFAGCPPEYPGDPFVRHVASRFSREQAKAWVRARVEHAGHSPHIYTIRPLRASDPPAP